MAFEEIKASINLLLTEMENRPEDKHELLEMIHEKLEEMKAMGMPLPEDLVALEQGLQAEMTVARDVKD